MKEKSFASDISFLLPYSVLNNLNLGETLHFIYISRNLETIKCPFTEKWTKCGISIINRKKNKKEKLASDRRTNTGESQKKHIMKKVTYEKSARHKSTHVFHFKQTKIMYGDRSQTSGTMGAGSKKSTGELSRMMGI